MTHYTETFFDTHAGLSKGSAQHVAPLVLQLVNPQSVVDVGCGIGTWLSVFKDLGAQRILGIDGDYVKLDQLLFPKNDFLAHDLTRPLVLPDDKKGPYDLAVSLEVGEHIPTESSRQYVSTLASLAPVVLFSAALPHQGGTHHINEQWPNFWAKLFEENGYRTVDWLRPQIWGDPQVAYYYAQNSLLFVNPQKLDELPQLQPYVVAADDPSLSRVHPTLWQTVNDPRTRSVWYLLSALPVALSNAASRRINRILKK